MVRRASFHEKTLSTHLIKAAGDWEEDILTKVKEADAVCLKVKAGWWTTLRNNSQVFGHREWESDLYTGKEGSVPGTQTR